jgi:hypothetical protein
MKKILYLLFAVMMIAFSSCQKNILPKPDLIQSISNDLDFELYVTNLKEISSQPDLVDIKLNQTDFENYFKKAALENDSKSKEVIGKEMGFSNTNSFWEKRSVMIRSLKSLSEKYNLGNIKTEDWKSIVLSKLNNINANSKIKLNAYSIEGEDLCQEKYQNCINNSIATFATEQVGCVAFAGLGWTGVGLGLFAACELASNYHLSTSKKGCLIDFKSCKIK